MESSLYFKTRKRMSTAQIKSDILRYIDQLDDSFLAAVHAILNAHINRVDPIVGYDENGMAQRASEVKELFKADLAEGNYQTLEGLKKESEQW